MPTHTITVLGAGITGLSTAFHLARFLPGSSRITLLEQRNTIGGWINSQKSLLRADALTNTVGIEQNVLLETGPRTLRPNNLALLELVNLLDLTTSLLTVSQSHPASKARYISFPPLTLLPSSIPSVLRSRFSTNPVLQALLPSVLSELGRPPNRPTGIRDESVHSLVERRFGEEFARNYLSAIVHGIYAADARSLSVRATFPFLWEAETRGNGSILKGILKSMFTPRKGVKAEEDEGFELGSVKDTMKNVSMFTFKDGMRTLPGALANWLSTRSNVEIRTSTGVSSIKPTLTGIELTLSDSSTLTASHVISALPLPVLHKALHPSHPVPHLTANPSSTVLVINLIFPPSPTGKPHHPDGFGYLVPRPPSDYASSFPLSNSGHIDISPSLLGVIFDSAMPSPHSHSHSPPPFLPPLSQTLNQPQNLTRFTLMLGGPHPLPPQLPPLSSLLQPLLQSLSATLSISSLPLPLHANMTLQRNCIPTYAPGHLDRMAELREILQDNRGEWKGRMWVIGSGVGGVSLGDCVMQGRKAAKELSLLLGQNS
ncbi:uncharacterized protein EI90DRAFT_2909240 [Cantharellus anzutake]|uniref:uncharacterized protein n=1 Tax=Cantharellus anzutake TaxID=1750568 RepID=UPI00190630E1|nr:uncharacterized protein EI90DRAFT_2909240 [Cantharellus anzutake]KAF8338236.1 hypothetical protein EI90DRAFT_2909240 [Cantharellus anzutake]